LEGIGEADTETKKQDHTLTQLGITLQKSPEQFGMNYCVLLIIITISYSMCIHIYKTDGTPHSHSESFLNKPFAQGYADDLALSVTGKSLSAVSQLM
jgi:hypothetical protein